MATNIDKALYQAPTSLEDDAADIEEPIEIEIIDPEAVNIHADGLDISITEGDEDEDFSENLAEVLDQGAIDQIVGELAANIDQDKQSRKEWEKAYTEGLKLLGLQYEERTEPWNGACGVFHPMLTESVVRPVLLGNN